ncbi:abrin-b-like [Pyrus x bretschneideri]|uniref:abrin-b-like n=1 Tax=Pyrus x bretschneideri TaxID=225117 RepID=UPI0005108E3A|nr:abrin-b-like [Pyrus x bretschneideri]
MHKMRFLLAAACLVCLNVRVIEGRPGDIEFSTQDATGSELRGLLTRSDHAIDKENANVVAYVGGDKSYFLKDAPVAALNTLFPPTTSFYLPFTSSYTDLEKAGRKSRWEIPLGLTPLDNAITALWEGGDSKAAQSLLVTTQMVLEAAQSILVEQRVRHSIQDKIDFLPDAGVLANSGCPSEWAAMHAPVSNYPK